jgi:hypothetical protein
VIELLEVEGVQKFEDSYAQLASAISMQLTGARCASAGDSSTARGSCFSRQAGIIGRGGLSRLWRSRAAWCSWFPSSL